MIIDFSLKVLQDKRKQLSTEFKVWEKQGNFDICNKIQLEILDIDNGIEILSNELQSVNRNESKEKVCNHQLVYDHVKQESYCKHCNKWLVDIPQTDFDER